MDEIEKDEPVGGLTVGEQLRAAREAKGLSVEDIAAQTRIPTRHLENLELGQWDSLPAPTYTMGFAKSYASIVGLDRTEIADALRVEMGGVRAATTFQPELFEPADPKRVMPKGLVFGALAALLLAALLFNWFANRDSDDAPEATLNEAVAAPPAAAPAIAISQVAITAQEPAWVEIKDGAVILKQGELAQGETFSVPGDAAAPTLSTAKPEALRIMVGSTVAPPIGPRGTKVDNVSLLPADLLKGPAATTTAPAAAPARSTAPSASEPRPAPRRANPAKSPAPAASAPAPATTVPAPPVTTNSAG